MRELVGQGKPFYSSLDKAAGLLRRKVGTGSEFLKELMSIPGVKQAEVAERGLGELLNAPKMTHEQFMAALGTKPAPAIGEKVSGEDPSPEALRAHVNLLMKQMASKYADEGSDTSQEYRAIKADELRRMRENRMQDSLQEQAKRDLRTEPEHEKYTLPGGENYREMLIKAPKGGDQFPGVPQHFGGEPGILASLRLKDRTGPNGEKLLHLEELQSDWHQQGREKGYRGNQKRIDWNDPEYIAARKRAMELNNEFNRNSHRPDRQAEIQLLMEEATRVERSIIDNNNKVGNLVPDAPFKKNWEEMALKRLIHHAAENGYHGVVVTPGAEQADRYNLAKHIDSIMLVPNPQSNKETHPYYFKAFDKHGNRVANDAVDEAGLQEYIGKEPAKQLLSSPANPLGERMISGANIVTGGEGMKAFYDKKVPNILNGIGKKYGVKTELNGHAEKLDNGSLRHNSQGKQIEFPPEYRNLHYFPITEEMRQDVKKNGIPLYESGGSVSTQ